MKKKQLIALTCAYLFCALSALQAQDFEVYPPNWWAGMVNNKIQLLLYNKNGFETEQIAINHPQIQITKTHSFANNHYKAVDVTILPQAKTGNYTISVKQKNQAKPLQAAWSLKQKALGRGTEFAQGVQPKDLIYLIMPDRFSNGDTKNDIIPTTKDQTLNRDSVYHRHGGDLQGIINHINYLEQLGVTALWLTPVIENDMPNRTEHGYAFTNHYKIDERLGGAAAYKQLSAELHKRKLKLIQDNVYNHVGRSHFLFQDKPDETWFHQWDKFTQTSYKDQPLFDIYASKKDKKIMSDGWFTNEMPDVNQSNPFFAKYLIQHAIWCVEEFGVDGWRIDTYIYNDLNFMNACNAALTKEYPNITMFGETWVHGVPSQSYFCKNNVQAPFKSNLQGVTDFQSLFYGILPAMNENFGWTEGVNKLYTTLSYDFLYQNPMNNVVFLDNHDLNRIYSDLGENKDKLKMALAWVLTTRGIPQVYYGTEVLMKGQKNPNDGWVRLDFPGGWDNDKKSAFTNTGLTSDELDIKNYFQQLANFRKTSSAIGQGKMMQYVPNDGLYVYFRYSESQTLMCVMNTSDKPKEVDGKDYAERTQGFTTATNVVTKQKQSLTFTIPAKTMYVLTLDK